MIPKMCKGGKCEIDCVKAGSKMCKTCITYTEDYMFVDFVEAMQETGIHEVNWVDVQDFDGNVTNFETVEDFCKFVFKEENRG